MPQWHKLQVYNYVALVIRLASIFKQLFLSEVMCKETLVSTLLSTSGHRFKMEVKLSPAKRWTVLAVPCLVACLVGPWQPLRCRTWRNVRNCTSKHRSDRSEARFPLTGGWRNNRRLLRNGLVGYIEFRMKGCCNPTSYPTLAVFTFRGDLHFNRWNTIYQASVTFLLLSRSTHKSYRSLCNLPLKLPRIEVKWTSILGAVISYLGLLVGIVK